MNLRCLLLPVLSFAAGAAGFVAWRSHGQTAGDPAAAPLAPGRGGVPPGSGSPAVSAAGGPAGILAFAGLGAAPTLDDVFEATGLDRTLRMGIFLQTATSADMEAVLDRCQAERIHENSLTDQVWLRWVEIDREAAFRRDNGGTAIWWAWAKLDPKAALAAAAQATPRNLEEVIRAIGQGDHPWAIQLLSEHPAADTPLVWEGILNGLSKTDRGAAAALALEKNLKLKEYIGGWTAREPEQALAWARALSDPVQRRRALDLALEERITADPAAALRETAVLPPGRSRTGRTAEAITAMARLDPSAAREAAETLPNPADRQQAMAMLASHLAARDPAAALAILGTVSWKELSSLKSWSYTSDSGGSRSSSGGSGQGPEQEAVLQLMQSAPQATATALAALPAGSQAPLSAAIQEWAGHQPEAASTWLQGLTAGPVKDQAIRGLTNWLTYGSPEPDFEAALAWSAAATPDQQFVMMSNTISQWKQQDPMAARAAVERLPLTAERREQLLQNFN